MSVKMHMPSLQSMATDENGKLFPVWSKLLQELMTRANAELAPGRIQPFYLSAADLADATKFIQSGSTAGIGVGDYLGWALCNGNNGSPDEIVSSISSEPWNVATLENSWTPFGVGYGGCAFMRIGSRVYLKGLIKNGTAANAVMFTLPSTHSPSVAKLITTHSYSNTCVDLRILTNGSVYADTGGSTTWTSLDGCSFDAGPPDPTLYNLMRV